MNNSHNSIKAITLGLFAAMLTGFPSRWLPPISSAGSSRLDIIAAFLGPFLFFAALFAALLYLPALIGGYVTAYISHFHPTRDGAIVGALFIPGSIFLDYLRAGFLSFACIPCLVFIYVFVPLFAILGGYLQRRAHKSKTAVSDC